MLVVRKTSIFLSSSISGLLLAQRSRTSNGPVVMSIGVGSSDISLQEHLCQLCYIPPPPPDERCRIKWLHICCTRHHMLPACLHTSSVLSDSIIMQFYKKYHSTGRRRLRRRLPSPSARSLSSQLFSATFGFAKVCR